MITMPGNKRVTSIYIKDEIKEFCETHNINFSEWANETFTAQYLTLGSKIREFNEAVKRTEELKQQIHMLKEQSRAMADKLTADQKSFILDIPRLLKEGKDPGALRFRFNERFKTKYTQDEFLALLEFFINDY